MAAPVHVLMVPVTQNEKKNIQNVYLIIFLISLISLITMSLIDPGLPTSYKVHDQCTYKLVNCLKKMCHIKQTQTNQPIIYASISLQTYESNLSLTWDVFDLGRFDSGTF